MRTVEELEQAVTEAIAKERRQDLVIRELVKTQVALEGRADGLYHALCVLVKHEARCIHFCDDASPYECDCLAPERFYLLHARAFARRTGWLGP